MGEAAVAFFSALWHAGVVEVGVGTERIRGWLWALLAWAWDLGLLESVAFLVQSWRLGWSAMQGYPLSADRLAALPHSPSSLVHEAQELHELDLEQGEEVAHRLSQAGLGFSPWLG